jgi:ribosomal protein S18 acetylase RimI-like enzyme
MTPSTIAVRTATSADEAAVVHTIVLAFAADPMARWAWPNAHDYLTLMPAMTRAFGGRAFANDAAYCTGDCAAAALWLPPGVSPEEEAMMEMMQRTLDEPRRTEMFAVFEQMGNFHPHEPHWYLPLIGVDPAYQGKGYGSALLRATTDRFDREGAVAYLESSNPRNIPLYERHGFEQVGRIQAGSSPEVVPMIRRPRR